MSEREPPIPLPSSPPPPPSPETRERAWQAARAAFQESQTRPSRKVTLFPGPRLPALVAAACLALILGGWMWLTDPAEDSVRSITGSPRQVAPEKTSEEFAAWGDTELAFRILEELQAVFPKQLSAFIVSPEKSEIITTDRPSTFSSQPLLVELRTPKSAVRIVSFSGQTVTAKVDNQEYSLEFLITGDGHVLITGDNFHWHSADPQARASSPFTIQSTIL